MTRPAASGENAAMVRGCVKTLLVLVACVGLSYVLVAGRVPPPRDRFAALAAGLSLWLGWGCVETAGEARRNMAALRAAMAGERPLDGARAAAIGPIHAASGRPLAAPISGKPCVLYEYGIHTTGSEESKEPLAAGFALAPSEMRSPAGPIRLLGYPMNTKLQEHVRVAPADRERATAYLASTAFEPRSASSSRR